MFPPFNLINRALSKVRRDRTPLVLAILLNWPVQPWYGTMLNMLLDSTSPLPLATSKNTLILPWDSSITHLNSGQLKLSVVLCGTDYGMNSYLTKLQ